MQLISKERVKEIELIKAEHKIRLKEIEALYSECPICREVKLKEWFVDNYCLRCDEIVADGMIEDLRESRMM